MKIIIFIIAAKQNKIPVTFQQVAFDEKTSTYFHNVCELDLVFNFYKVNFKSFKKDYFFSHFYVIFNQLKKVYSVVDEMFLAGEIRETSQTKVLKQLQTLAQQE